MHKMNIFFIEKATETGDEKWNTKFKGKTLVLKFI